MLLIFVRTLMSPYKKGLGGSLACKNLYDLSTPIPVSKFQDKLGNCLCSWELRRSSLESKLTQKNVLFFILISFACHIRYSFTIYLQLVPQILDMLTQLVQFPFGRPIHHNLPLLELPWSAIIGDNSNSKPV